MPVTVFPATGALFGEKTLKVAANLFSWTNLDRSALMNQDDIQLECRGHPAAFVDWNPMSLKTVCTQFLSGNLVDWDSGQAKRHCATQGKSFAARRESVCLHYKKKNRWKQVMLSTNKSEYWQCIWLLISSVIRYQPLVCAAFRQTSIFPFYVADFCSLLTSIHYIEEEPPVYSFFIRSPLT